MSWRRRWRRGRGSGFLFALPIEDLHKSTMQMRTRGIILAIGGVQAVALAGCAASGPDMQGFSSERLRRLDSVFVQQAIARGTMPGVVMLVARNGNIVKFSADGYLDARKTKPMRRDAIFRLASMSKPLVAVAAMTLVESGQIKLTDPIAKWIPELKDMKVLVEATDSRGAVTRQTVPASRPITVQDLLRHTSGFCYADFAPSAELLAAYTKADLDGLETELSPDEFIHRLSEIPLAWQPGTRWQYGYSMDVLGGPARASHRTAPRSFARRRPFQTTPHAAHGLSSKAGRSRSSGRAIRLESKPRTEIRASTRRRPGPAVPLSGRGTGFHGGGLLPVFADASQRRGARPRTHPLSEDRGIDDLRSHPGSRRACSRSPGPAMGSGSVSPSVDRTASRRRQDLPATTTGRADTAPPSRWTPARRSLPSSCLKTPAGTICGSSSRIWCTPPSRIDETDSRPRPAVYLGRVVATVQPS